MATVRFEAVTKRYPNGFRAVRDLDLDVGDGELLVVVGPSGCGKSTTLRMLAGLEDVSDGKIWIGDECVNDVEARKRNIAMVFQSYALYPHLTVGGNLAYPLKVAGVDKTAREARVREVAATLRLTELLDRKPRQLSGGQRQRVAMGRAMVREPKVFLMDEPLSNLDAKLRVAMRAEVSELQRSLQATMFYVTHDQVEAMTMGDRVAVMDQGVLQQVATPDELYHRPANAFVAGFIGSPPMNRLVATVRTEGDHVAASSGTVDVSHLSDGLGALALDSVERVVLGARPEHCGLVAPGDGLPGVVRLVEHLGSESIVHVDAAGLELFQPEHDEHDSDASPRLLVTVRDDRLALRPGDVVHVRVPERHLHAFDAVSGVAIRDTRR
jgi:multiple sugar transport system ATP-binding protein